MSEKSYSHLPIGTVLKEQYRIDGALGRGGFGVTYAAYDLSLNRKVAVKECFPRGLVYRAQDGVTVRLYADMESKGDVYERSKRRALEEAKTLAKAQTLPHAVRVYDGFMENGTAYLVMELVEGETLAARVEREGKLGWEKLSSLMLPLAVDLYKLHKGNIMHRDISPDNVMIRKDTGDAVLLDFGASHKIHDDTTKETNSLRIGYAPIEQYGGNLANQDERTDEYAFCATLYFALTGKQPLDAMTRFTGEQLTPPARLGSDIPPACEVALMRGMAVDRKDRYGSMLELRAAFEIAKKNPKLRKVDVPGGEEGKRLESMLLSGIQPESVPASVKEDVPAYLLSPKLGKRAPGYEAGLENKRIVKPIAQPVQSAPKKPSMRVKTVEIVPERTKEIIPQAKNSGNSKLTALLILGIAVLILGLIVLTTKLFTGGKGKAPVPTAEPMPIVTEAPAAEPTAEPMPLVTEAPTAEPVTEVTQAPTEAPVTEPVAEVTEAPSEEPEVEPIAEITPEPEKTDMTEQAAEAAEEQTEKPTEEPTQAPTAEPTATPTAEPTETPTAEPTETPTAEPTAAPTAEPTATPTAEPTATPTAEPTATPTAEPTVTPTAEPTATPTAEPTATPDAVIRVTLPQAVMESAGVGAAATAEPVKRTSKDKKYELLEYADGTCKIREYKGSDKVLAIPAEIDGLKVIAVDGFDGNENLQEVTIPEGVMSIEPDAFSVCPKLKKVSIPKSVKSIGKYAFYECPVLEGVTIPSGVTEIEANAFDGCISLKNVTLEEGVKNLGNRAFYNCASLINITIPASCERVGNECFKECVSLKEVIWYPSACTIGGEMFSGCEALERISGYSQQSLEIAQMLVKTHMMLKAP